LRNQSATATITHAVTVADGVFAPGHLDELTQYLPFELADDVLAQTRTVQRRLRALPSRTGVYLVLALGMFPHLGYLHVWAKLTVGSRRRGRCRWQPSRQRQRPGTGSGACARARSAPRSAWDASSAPSSSP
jgi:hypothetical protein